MELILIVNELSKLIKHCKKRFSFHNFIFWLSTTVKVVLVLVNIFSFLKYIEPILIIIMNYILYEKWKDG